MASGVVKMVLDAQGKGIITPDSGGQDIQFECQPNQFKEGQRVTYDAGRGPRGVVAQNVQPA